MEAYLYFPPDLEVDRDDIEAGLEEAFGEAGEVTGAGSGVKGSNLDLRVHDRVGIEKTWEIIVGVLSKLEIPSANVVIDGKRFSFKR